MLCVTSLRATQPLEPWPEDYELTLTVSLEKAEADYAALQPALDRAVQEAESGKSVRVLVGPGMYRGAFSLQGLPGNVYAPISIEAEEPGRAILCGSRVVDGWEVGDSGYFQMDFPAGERVVGVYVQSVRVEQVRADRRLRQGQFRVVQKGSPTEGSQVQMIQPENATVADGLVEVATEVPGGILRIRDLDTVTLSGLYLRQGGGIGVFVKDCRRVRVEHATSEHQHIAGYHFEDIAELKLINADALRNGKEGIKAANVAAMNVIGGATSNNGYRTGVDMMSADAFGMQCQSVKQLSLRNFQAADNLGAGLGAYYADTVSLRSSKLLNNRLGAVFYHDKTVTLKEAIVAANTSGGLMAMGTDCSAMWSIFSGNGGRESGVYVAQLAAMDGAKLSLKHCIVSATQADIPLLAIDDLGALGQLSGNLYWGSDEPFIFADIIPDKAGGRERPSLDFAAWQAVSGQDLNSAWGDPMFNDPAGFEFIPLGESIWYQQRTWPVRTVTAEETAAARAAYFPSADQP